MKNVLLIGMFFMLGLVGCDDAKEPPPTKIYLIQPFSEPAKEARLIAQAAPAEPADWGEIRIITVEDPDSVEAVHRELVTLFPDRRILLTVWFRHNYTYSKKLKFDVVIYASNDARSLAVNFQAYSAQEMIKLIRQWKEIY